MYVGNKYTATRQHTDLRDFVCKACHYQGRAVVVGVGQGAGNSAYFLDNSGARERAGAAADEAAETNAVLTLSLARCPRCGNRDEAAVRFFWLKMAATLVASALFLWGIGAVVAAIQGPDPVLFWIFGPLGFAMPPLIWWMESWKWTTVDRRVVFADDATG